MYPAHEEIEDAIRSLGLRYSILTPFTSFYAVDNVLDNKTGKVKTVKQPLPLPAGVSSYAVGQAGQTWQTSALGGHFEGDSLLSLIDAATVKKIPEKGKKGSSGSSAKNGMPQTPSKNEVLALMKKARKKIKSCSGGVTVILVVSITIEGSTGKVLHVWLLDKSFQGTDLEKCVVKSLKGLVFQKFAQKTFSVTYPFVLK